MKGADSNLGGGSRPQHFLSIGVSASGGPTIHGCFEKVKGDLK